MYFMTTEYTARIAPHVRSFAVTLPDLTLIMQRIQVAQLLLRQLALITRYRPRHTLA